MFILCACETCFHEDITRTVKAYVLKKICLILLLSPWLENNGVTKYNLKKYPNAKGEI